MITSPPISDCYLTGFSCWLAARRTQARIYLRNSRTAARKIISLNMHPGRSARPPHPKLEQTDRTTRHGGA
jgi:hypothetical protein